MQESNKAIEKGSFKLLDMLHHFTSGYKAIMTENCYNHIDKLRQACGGAAYQMSSGIAQM